MGIRGDKHSHQQGLIPSPKLYPLLSQPQGGVLSVNGEDTWIMKQQALEVRLAPELWTYLHHLEDALRIQASLPHLPHARHNSLAGH